MSKLDSDLVMSADRGTRHLYGTTDYNTESLAAIVVLEDAVFTNLEEHNDNKSGSSIDALQADEQNLVTNSTTVFKGEILRPRQDIFSRVKLQSGTVQGIRA